MDPADYPFFLFDWTLQNRYTKENYDSSTQLNSLIYLEYIYINTTRERRDPYVLAIARELK
jgi:hypothetical protein